MKRQAKGSFAAAIQTGCTAALGRFETDVGSMTYWAALLAISQGQAWESVKPRFECLA
jgi:hypothetical protein